MSDKEKGWEIEEEEEARRGAALVWEWNRQQVNFFPFFFFFL